MFRGNTTNVEPLCGDDDDSRRDKIMGRPTTQHLPQPIHTHTHAHLPPLLIAFIAYVYAEAVMGSPSALALSKAVAAWRHIRNEAKSARTFCSRRGTGAGAYAVEANKTRVSVKCVRACVWARTGCT